MSNEANDPSVPEPDGVSDLVRRLMRKQAALSMRVAAVFVVFLIGLPLVNLYFPRQAGTEEYGFPLTWLVLAVLFYPFTWILSAYFVRRSDALEAQIAETEQAHRAAARVEPEGAR